MSAFLGPIHHMLYGKIKFQNDFTNRLISELATTEIAAEIDKIAENIPTGLIEDIVDQNNIHASLQEMISKIEKRLAIVVTLLKANGITMDKLILLAKDYGRENALSENFESPKDAIEAYTMLSTKLVNGMPCDRVQVILQKDKDSVLWQDRMDIHQKYWNEIGGDAGDFYILRQAVIQGILGSAFKVEEVGPYMFQLERNKIKDKDNIALLMEEHDNILAMIGLMEEKSVALMNNKEEEVDSFFGFIDFARNYADKHHHGKEEQILFKYMTENLGLTAEKLVNHGMLVEHNLGRLYVGNLEESVKAYKADKSDLNRLAILTNAMGYGELLKRHIAKENEVVYTFAKRELAPEVMEKVEIETEIFETENAQVREKYLEWLKGKQFSIWKK